MTRTQSSKSVWADTLKIDFLKNRGSFSPALSQRFVSAPAPRRGPRGATTMRARSAGPLRGAAANAAESFPEVSHIFFCLIVSFFPPTNVAASRQHLHRSIVSMYEHRTIHIERTPPSLHLPPPPPPPPQPSPPESYH